MAEYTNPCDLCKHRDNCTDDCVLDVYSSKYLCTQHDCFVNYEGSKAGNSFLDMEYIGGCEFTNYCRRESDFCSYGERKDGDGNG